MEDAFCEEAKRRGAWTFKSEGLWPGFPDRIVLAPPGRFRLVELKRPGVTALRVAQDIFRGVLAKIGFEVHVLNDAGDVRRWFDEWLGES